ncbi:hypothetical protein [Marivirga sp.]|uniref:hypothetical protein n=1 Tax=Marivirga sp. TaxID=2018662 RepID=UPI002D809EA3|nr:hypothetical protein [Marivirga sp.]HET8859773.1 hypothetical protein [Marivirga sp.]
MRKFDLVVVICLVFFTFSCSEKAKVPKLIEQKIKNYERVVFIPHQGCLGCSREALELLENYYNYPKTLFVITKIDELRAVKIELNSSFNLNKATNVILDEENEIVSEIEIDIYPTIYNIEENKLFFLKEAKNGIQQYLN